MGAPVFGNELFDQWLNQKSHDILAKVEREKISNEDMLILSLKAQVNHFQQIEIEFRDEFKNIDQRFENLETKFDRRFDRLSSILMWGFALFITSVLAVLAKLYIQ